jgi:hypothetical protein
LTKNIRLELEPPEISTVIASLGKSRYSSESVRKDQVTADSLQLIKAQRNFT